MDKMDKLRAALNAMGPPKGMSGYTKPRPAPTPHAVVVYAFPKEKQDAQEALCGASIQQYYADCRARGPAVYVGD